MVERRAGAVRAAFAHAALRARIARARRAVPTRLRTLAQRFRGSTYYYAPEARGRVRLGRLLSWRFDADAVSRTSSRAAVVAALKVESFRMTFPVARVAEE